MNTDAYGLKTETGSLLLPYNFNWPYYDTTPPWYSAMAQAEALPLLNKAYNLTGIEKYKDTANQILNSFFIEVKDGGVTYKDDNGWWYELYADTGSKQPRVLNGMLWTLIALNDYYSVTKDYKSKFLFDQGVKGLKNYLPRFDLQNTSSYDIFNKPASYDYHQIHINLLQKLYAITHEEIFKNYSTHWSEYKLPKPKITPSFNIYLDKDLIPFVDYGERDGKFIGIQRNPVTVDHVARDYYEKYLEFSDPFFKTAFLNNVNWLVNNAVPINKSESIK